MIPNNQSQKDVEGQANDSNQNGKSHPIHCFALAHTDPQMHPSQDVDTKAATNFVEWTKKDHQDEYVAKT